MRWFLAIVVLAGVVLGPRVAAATDCPISCASHLCRHQYDGAWAVAEGVVVQVGSEPDRVIVVERTGIWGPLADEVEAHDDARHEVYKPSREQIALGTRVVLVFEPNLSGAASLSSWLLVDANDRVVCPTSRSVTMDRERALRLMQRANCEEAASETDWGSECGGCMGCASGGAAESGAAAAMLALAALRRRARSA